MQKKYFAIYHYRLLATLCVFSVLVALVLLCVIVLFYFSRSEIVFYASNSAGKITLLEPKDDFNRTDRYWLPPDPVEEMATKKEVMDG